MDPDLRSQLNMLLINGGHDKKIQDHLLYTLNAHPNNWPTQVQSRALALLRSGEVTTFPVLLKQVLDEVRRETSLRPNPGSSSSTNNNATNANATNNTAAPADPPAGAGGNNNNNGSSSSSSSSVQVNGGGGGAAAGSGPRGGSHRGPGPGEASNLNRETPSSLAVPAAVVDEALKVTSQALREVAEFEEENGAA